MIPPNLAEERLMLAARLTATGVVGVAEVPDPVGGRVLVRSETMGICGTDLEIVSGSVPVSLPRILGHEMVGRVVTSTDPDLAEGSRVLVDPAISCGSCHQCRAWRPHLCTEGGLMGREVDGVLAELATVDSGSLHLVPDDLDERQAGLLQVLGTCLHGLAPIEVHPGEIAVVIGLGVVGQLMVRLLNAQGAKVVGVTRSGEKRAMAAHHGATVAHPDDAAGAVGELTSGVGASLVVEAAGTAPTLARGIELASPAAHIVAFGIITGGGELPMYQLYSKELTLWSRRAALPEDYSRAISLLQDGQLEVGDIVTHSFPLTDIGKAFAAASDPASLKVLLSNPQ